MRQAVVVAGRGTTRRRRREKGASLDLRVEKERRGGFNACREG